LNKKIKGHGIRKYNGDRMTGEKNAYRDQYNHRTYEFLNQEQQTEIKNRMNGIWGQ